MEGIGLDFVQEYTGDEKEYRDNGGYDEGVDDIRLDGEKVAVKQAVHEDASTDDQKVLEEVGEFPEVLAKSNQASWLELFQVAKLFQLKQQAH